MSYIGDGIALAIGWVMVMIFAAGVGLTLFVVFVIPWLWRLVKPWLHTITG